MKKIIIGFIVGLIFAVLLCFIVIDLRSDSVNSAIKCSWPEFIYYLSQIIGVGVTFLAVIVALFGNEIRSKFFRARCQVSITNDSSFREELGDSVDTESPSARYYGCILEVKNIGSKEVSDCELIISEVSYKTDAQQKKDKNLLKNGHQSLYWSSKESKRLHLIIGEARELCLFRIYPSSTMQTPDGGIESPLRLNIMGYNLEEKYSKKGIWKVVYKLQTKERVLQEFSVTVDWSGRWFNRIQEMGSEVNANLKLIKK